MGITVPTAAKVSLVHLFVLAVDARRYYTAIVNKDIHTMLKENTESETVSHNLQNVIMQLRKCCNHPYLFEWPKDEKEYFANLTKYSGKMLVLQRILARLKRDGHRVLIFSQMAKMLQILGVFMESEEYAFHLIDGSTPQEERVEMVSGHYLHSLLLIRSSPDYRL